MFKSKNTKDTIKTTIITSERYVYTSEEFDNLYKKFINNGWSLREYIDCIACFKAVFVKKVDDVDFFS